MVKSRAANVKDYLDELPKDRRAIVSRIREIILENLPEGYQESMNWGMISYEIPLKLYPRTYNGQPLSYVALASQKNHLAIYVMSVYENSPLEAWLRGEFEKAGKQLDMGKACIRFRKLEDLPLETIGRLIAATTVEDFIAAYEASRKR